MPDKNGLLTPAELYRLNSAGLSFVIRNALNVTLEPYVSLTQRLTEWIKEQEDSETDHDKVYWYRINEIWRRIVARTMKDDDLRLVGHFKAAFYKWFGVRL